MAYTAIAKSIIPASELNSMQINYDWSVSFDIPTSAGLGASAALSVALAMAINQHVKLHRPIEAIAQAAQLAEHIFSGNPSGLDAYLAQFGGFGVFSKEQGFSPIKWNH